MTQEEKLLTVAAKYIGIKEVPPGSNKVPGVPWVGSYGSPWCCKYVWGCFKEAGLAALFYDGKSTSYCPDVHTWAKKGGLVVDKAKGQPGDIILFDWEPNGAANHIGLIEKTIPGGYQTIEGNWNDAVMRVTRTKMGDVLAVIRPKWTDAAEKTPIKPGDFVKIRPGVVLYYPGGSKIPDWVFGKKYTVGSARERGGVACVLLKELDSSCAVVNLEKV
jgi:hypothetical protein